MSSACHFGNAKHLVLSYRDKVPTRIILDASIICNQRLLHAGGANTDCGTISERNHAPHCINRNKYHHRNILQPLAREEEATMAATEVDKQQAQPDLYLVVSLENQLRPLEPCLTSFCSPTKIPSTSRTFSATLHVLSHGSNISTSRLAMGAS